MRVSLGSLRVSVVALVAVTPGEVSAHGTHGPASGPVGHVGAGVATIRPDEKLKLSIDLFGYLSGSVASGWHGGEPLGAGGKIPLFYNQSLYREGPFERTGLAKKDYWPQYRDFSYNPLWQPTQLGVRVQYRFLPTLQGTVTPVYFGSFDRVTVEPNPIELEELFVRWTPELVPGLSISFGHLLLVGSYAAAFDQFPLEIFQFNGAAVALERTAGTSELRGQIAAGRIPLGRTTQVELIEPDPIRNHPALDGLRERTHIYATGGLTLANGLSLGFIGGYQVLPADQSTTNDPSPFVNKWPRSSGWHAGLEAALARGRLGQQVSVSYGSGDVEMAWGAPDYVYVEDPVVMHDRFSRKGSTLLQAVYWGHFISQRWRVLGGVWGQWRRPARMTRTWNVWDEPTQQSVPVNATTQAFRAAKVNLEPAVTLGPASFGVRMDAIRYFDKKATTDTVEPLTDEALRPVTVPSAMGLSPQAVRGPSRWEREAADSLIVSPFVACRIGEVLRLRASWSGAWYSHAIHRQRRNSDFHGNVTISAWLVHRFGIAP